MNRIEHGLLKGELPLATAIMPTLASRRALYVAVLLHDIAKGRGGDHSVLGEKIAYHLGPRFGLTDEETESVAWLVRNHLIMSDTAFRREKPTAEALPGADMPSPSVFDPASLPPIQSIVADSDIRLFLQAGVPAELTRAALRSAWTADPAIRDFIGIAESQWDFNDPATIPGFGSIKPAFEICIYRTSTLKVCLSPSKCMPSAAAGVKFTLEVPVGTWWLVKRTPPFNSK